MPLRRWVRIGILCGISAICLWFAVRGVDLDTVTRSMRGANWPLLAFTVMLTVGTILLRAWRWTFLLPRSSPARFSDLFIATAVGMTAVNLLPARIGELVRAYALRVRSGISFSTALATLFIERVMDLSAILAALGLVLWQLPVPPWVHMSGRVLLTVDLVILISLFALKRWPDPGVALLRHVLTPLMPGRSRWIEGVVRSFVDGLSMLGRPRRLAAALAGTVVLWLVVAAAIGSCLRAMGAPSSPFAAFTVMAILAVGLTVPSGPGFIGTFEFFTVLGLELVGVSRGGALAFAVVFHASQFLPTVLLGLIAMWAGGLTVNVTLPVCSMAPETSPRLGKVISER